MARRDVLSNTIYAHIGDRVIFDDGPVDPVEIYPVRHVRYYVVADYVIVAPFGGEDARKAARTHTADGIIFQDARIGRVVHDV